jgi:hypothetical protein
VPVRPPIIRQSREEKGTTVRTTHLPKAMSPVFKTCISRAHVYDPPCSKQEEAAYARIHLASKAGSAGCTQVQVQVTSTCHSVQLNTKGTREARGPAPVFLASQGLHRAGCKSYSRRKARCNLHARLKGPCQASAAGAALS